MPGLARHAEGLDALEVSRPTCSATRSAASCQHLAHRAGPRPRLVLAATTPGWVTGSPAAMAHMSTPLSYYSRAVYDRTIGDIAGGRARTDRPGSSATPRSARRIRPPARYAYQLAARPPPGSLPWLHELEQPTLVLAGDDDPICRCQRLLLAQRIPRARCCSGAGEGHLLLLDPDSAAHPAIRDFVRCDELEAQKRIRAASRSTRRWSRRRARRRRPAPSLAMLTRSRAPSTAGRERMAAMRKLQTQGVHHITIVGADRQTSIDFWEGVLGMPFVFEQPNLDREAESHLYFDPGDGRLITIFTNDERTSDPSARRPTRLRAPHRVLGLAGDFSAVRRAARRARDQAQGRQGPRLHGLDLLRGPARLLIELASYRFEPPEHFTHAEVLLEAHKLRVERDDYHIDRVHLADAIEQMNEALARLALRGPLPEEPVPLEEEEPHGSKHPEHPHAEREQPHRSDLRAGRRARLRGERTSGARRPSPPSWPRTPRTSRRCSRRTGCRAARCGRAARSAPTSATSTGSTSSTRPIRASGRWSTTRTST